MELMLKRIDFVFKLLTDMKAVNKFLVFFDKGTHKNVDVLPNTFNYVDDAQFIVSYNARGDTPIPFLFDSQNWEWQPTYIVQNEESFPFSVIFNGSANNKEQASKMANVMFEALKTKKEIIDYQIKN